MKKIRLLFCFTIITFSASGQQFLWSTSETFLSKYVPLEDVTNEVLNYFEHYQFYYDGAGYSKSNFLKTIEKYGDKTENWKSFKEMILKIENLSVFAIRTNTGKGSEILVICITKENVNFVSFSNNYESDSQIILDTKSEREKFAKWFQTLLN